jgi:hypothetical protein
MIAFDAAPSHMHLMPYHRFKVGQTIVAPSGGPHAVIPRGPHVIVRLLPLVMAILSTGSVAAPTGLIGWFAKVRSGWSRRLRRGQGRRVDRVSSFWDPAGAPALVQIRRDRSAGLWEDRAATPSGQNHPPRAGGGCRLSVPARRTYAPQRRSTLSCAAAIEHSGRRRKRAGTARSNCVQCPASMT